MIKFHVHASGSAGNLYQLVSGKTSLIIDPGVPIRRIKEFLKFKLNGVSGALVSHSHGDHSKGVHSLAKFGVNCWMTLSTALALKFQGHRLCFIEPMRQFRIGDFQIVAFNTEHDCAGSVGFIISDGEDQLLFATDTFYLRNKFSNLTIVAIECNYSEETMTPGLHPVRLRRLYKSHFSLENVKKFISANDMSQVREIHLIHMSQANADPGYFQDEIERLTGKPTITHM